MKKFSALLCAAALMLSVLSLAFAATDGLTNAYPNQFLGATVSGEYTYEGVSTPYSKGDLEKTVDGDLETKIELYNTSQSKQTTPDVFTYSMTLEKNSVMTLNTIRIFTTHNGPLTTAEHMTVKGKLSADGAYEDLSVNWGASGRIGLYTDYNAYYELVLNSSVNVYGVKIIFRDASADNGCQATSFREIAAYDIPQNVTQEMRFMCTHHNDDQNLADVVMIAHVGGEVANEYDQIVFKCVAYYFKPNDDGDVKACWKTETEIADNNVYNTVKIGESEYTISSFDKSSGYLSAVVLTDIPSYSLSGHSGKSISYVLAQVYGRNGDGDTALTQQYMVEIPLA